MKTTELGRTGMTVSAIGLGCAGMSSAYGAASDEESLITLRGAIERGVTLLDTSDLYGAGHNETLIGRFLKEARRNDVLIGTKFGSLPGTADLPGNEGETSRGINNRPEYIVRACDASLTRLGIDVIDIYYMHRRDPNVPLADSIGAMSRLVEAGKVRWLGLSEVSAQTLTAAHCIHPITALQSEYSLWTRDPEAEVLPVCRDLGISFVAFSPLGRAFLTGTFDHASLSAKDFRSSLPRFQSDALEKNQRLVNALADMATDIRITPAQLALAWLLAKTDDGLSVIPIPGTRRLQYVEENIAAAAMTLSSAQLDQLDALFAPGAVTGARYDDAEAQRAGT